MCGFGFVFVVMFLLMLIGNVYVNGQSWTKRLFSKVPPRLTSPHLTSFHQNHLGMRVCVRV